MIISRKKFEAEYQRGKKDFQEYRDNELKTVREENIRLHNYVHDKDEEIHKLSSKIREQSKNDMIAKALEVIVKGLKLNTTADNIAPIYNAMLQQQQIMMQQSACLPSYSVFGGILR